MTARLFADADELPARPLTPAACVYCHKALPGNGQCDASGGPCHGPPERPVSMLDATDPPGCLAGGVTTRADVAPPVCCAFHATGGPRVERHGRHFAHGYQSEQPSEDPAQIGHVGAALGVRS